VTKNGSILHQTVFQENPLTGHNVGPREQDATVGVGYLSRNRRLPGIGAVGEKSENKESKQKDENYGLNPAFGQRNPRLVVVPIGSIVPEKFGPFSTVPHGGPYHD